MLAVPEAPHEHGTHLKGVAVVVATYNSERYMEGLRENLHAQRLALTALNYTMEIHCFDGGSTDATRSQIGEFGWALHENVAGDPISAKELAARSVESEFLCFLDHDERLSDSFSLANRLQVLDSDSSMVAIFPSGYDVTGLSPSGAFGSQFGDIFSALNYKTVNDSRFRHAILERIGFTQHPRFSSVICASLPLQGPLILEAVAGACLVRRSALAGLLTSPSSGSRLPNLVHLLGEGLVGHHSGDPVLHVSDDSWGVIRRKQDWRIRKAFDAKSSGVRSRPEGSLRSRLTLFRVLLGGSLFLPALLDGILLSRRTGGRLIWVTVKLEFWFVISFARCALGKAKEMLGFSHQPYPRYGQ